MNKRSLLLFALTAALVFGALYYTSTILHKTMPNSGLPVMGNSDHRIKSFSFTDQNGHSFTDADVTGKVYVAEYFFTTCKSICPIMNGELEKLAEDFKTDDRVLFLSHTVDPETDNVGAMKAYADAHHAGDKHWFFLTGPKKALYELARDSYLLDAHEGDGGEDDFIHTQNVALVDKERQIRGFYDATKPDEMVKLKADILKLLAEE